jgi:hypothetical protein
MKSTNLSLLPDHERRDIELQRQAALLINNMRRGKITRSAVQAKINKLPKHEQEQFKNHLNKYRSMK